MTMNLGVGGHYLTQYEDHQSCHQPWERPTPGYVDGDRSLWSEEAAWKETDSNERKR